VIRRLSCGDEGSIAPLFPMLVIAMFTIGGLVVDGSRDLEARGRAQSYAEEAARAGASAVNLDLNTLTLDQARATQLVNDYCTAVTGPTSAVQSCGLDNPAFTQAETCDGTMSEIVVHTVVQLKIQTTLLGIVGVTELTAGGAGKARPYEGTDQGNAC
jgi:Flp pilus assembly protein TadG